MKTLLVMISFVIVFTACAPPTPSVGAIQTAIAQTQAAQPTSPIKPPTQTHTPTQLPTNTPTPTSTYTPTPAYTPTQTSTSTLTPSLTFTQTETPTKTLIPTSTQTPTIYPLSVVTILYNMNNMNDTQRTEFCNKIIGARVNWTLKVENINMGSQFKYPNSLTLVLPGYEDWFLGIWLMNLNASQLSKYRIGNLITFSAYIRSCTWNEISVDNPTFK